MASIDSLSVGDQFQDPRLTNSIIYHVEGVNYKYGVKVQAYSWATGCPIGPPVWKSANDKIFSRKWRL